VVISVAGKLSCRELASRPITVFQVKEYRERLGGLGQHLQAAEDFLKKRRSARNPVMPIPSRANEAGSGTPVEENA
jgi:hypothetical protein